MTDMLAIKDDFGFVTKGIEDRKKYPARQPPELINATALKRFISQSVDAQIRGEVERIIQERKERIDREIALALSEPERVSIGGIQIIVSDVTGAALADLHGPRRSRNLAWPRFFGYFLMKTLRPDLSLPQIGKAWGNRDHTSIIHGLRQFTKMREDAPFSDWLADPRVQALLASK